ncbi:TonB-dependent receptor [Alcaligenes faecalis]|uniref:TonB-dependent receptor n=1 Tax=Alcaligenes faecalis TaxID=511 RepID=UPI001D17528F|nr:TonB-dependent siderophore receptor [Alcaligenes faecalis]
MSFVSPLPPRRFAETVLSAALFAALTSPVIAQTAHPGVTELQSIKVQGSVDGTGIDGYQAKRVQSNKVTAPLLDTPRTIMVIPQEVIRDRGASSLQDVLRTTPGITLGSGEGGTPTGDRPFIRGYEASTDIFIDGLRDYARGSHDTFNLESVEVLKGPSSAFGGRGGTGGSINLQTKKPKLSDFFEVSAGVGTDSQYQMLVDGNYAFTDSSAFRLNMMRMGGDMPGRDGVEIDRWGIAPSIAFGLGTPTRVVLSYSHVENRDTPDWGIPFVNSKTDRNEPLTVDRNNFYGRSKVDYRKNIFDTATVDVEHDINDRLTVRNVTRYGKSLNEYLYTRPSFDNCADPGRRNAVSKITPSCYTEGPELEFVRQNRARWRESESLINQTEIFGQFNTGAIQHEFIAGLEFSKEEIYSRDTLPGMDGPKFDYDSFWNPNHNRSYNRNLAFGSKYKDGSLRNSSLFFLDTIHLNEQWLLNAGIRYDSFKVNDDKNGLSRKDNMFNYQAGIVYKPLPNGSIYLSYGTSSNPSGENLGQAGGADGPAGAAQVRDLKPERSQSWELGTKWDVAGDHLSLTAAIFETEKKDARSHAGDNETVTLGGQNRVRGLELGATGAITPKWSVWAGYSYLDPKVLSYNNAGNVYDGKQIKFIAKHNASLWTTYKVLPQWTVGGGVTYVGSRFVDDANSLRLPSHTVYDAMVSYDVTKHFNLRLNANNLSNARMYDASHVGIFANVGPGRSYMLNATYRFE